MKKRTLLLLSTLAGVANGIWMLILHIQYEKLGGVCSVNQKISCEVLTYKQYSEWLGIPSPVYALFTFLLLFILAYRGWKNIGTHRGREDTYTFMLSHIAMIAAVTMASISFFVLKKLCIFCFIYYVIILVTWFTARSIAKSHGQDHLASVQEHFPALIRSQWFWFAGVAFACVLTFSHFALQSTATLSDTAIAIRGDKMKTTGNPNSKVTMTIFSDFECPACKNAANVLKELEKEGYLSKIKVVYKFFPLDPSCNRGTPYGPHIMACDAARASVCAAQQNKFWRYHDRLFEEQPSFYESKFYKIAEEENLNMKSFSACWKNKTVIDEVKNDIEEGISAPVTGTPSIFLNGKKLQGGVTLESMKKAIDSLL